MSLRLKPCLEKYLPVGKQTKNLTVYLLCSGEEGFQTYTRLFRHTDRATWCWGWWLWWCGAKFEGGVIARSWSKNFVREILCSSSVHPSMQKDYYQQERHVQRARRKEDLTTATQQTLFTTYLPSPSRNILCEILRLWTLRSFTYSLSLHPSCRPPQARNLSHGR